MIGEVLAEFDSENNTEVATRRPPPDHQGSTIGPNRGIRLSPRQPNLAFRDSIGLPLALGDRVSINNMRRTGTAGDLAEIVKFNRIYVAVKVLRTGSSIQRSSANLTFIE